MQVAIAAKAVLAEEGRASPCCLQQPCSGQPPSAEARQLVLVGVQVVDFGKHPDLAPLKPHMLTVVVALAIVVQAREEAAMLVVDGEVLPERQDLLEEFAAEAVTPGPDVGGRHGALLFALRVCSFMNFRFRREFRATMTSARLLCSSFFVASVSLLLALLLSLGDVSGPSALQPVNVWSYYLPMADGTLLAADLHAPAEAAAAAEVAGGDDGEGRRPSPQGAPSPTRPTLPYPVVMHFTPHVRSWRVGWPLSLWIGPVFNAQTGPVVRDLAAAGFAVLSVDVRGTGASFGDRDCGAALPDMRETDDLVTVLLWVLEQPWCNGQLGVYGRGYDGVLAELLASSQHPAVKAAALLASPFDVADEVVMPGGIYRQTAVDGAVGMAEPAPSLWQWQGGRGHHTFGDHGDGGGGGGEGAALYLLSSLRRAAATITGALGMDDISRALDTPLLHPHVPAEVVEAVETAEEAAAAAAAAAAASEEASEQATNEKPSRDGQQRRKRSSAG